MERQLTQTRHGLLAMVVAVIAMVGCKDGKNPQNPTAADTVAVEQGEADSTVYGVCGEATSMNSLELITDAGDTIQYMLLDGDDSMADMQGGLMVGDRLAVLGQEREGESYARQVINLTTLLGKWSSLDKNFEILEGGVVKSRVKAESAPWTSWRICNGKLLLNRDTFTVNTLGADTLYLENKDGIFAYQRAKNN